MAVLLVLFEIKNEDKRTKIVGAVRRRHRLCVQLTETAYAIYTSALPVRVFDEVRRLLDGNDILYVLPVTRPFTGYGPRKTSEWLNDCLPG